MTPHTTGGNGVGNLQIDRQITSLGVTRDERRIRVSLGSRDPKKLTRVNTIIDKLVEREAFDVLRALRDGAISPLALIEADRNDKTALTVSRVKLRAYLWDRDVDGIVEVGAISRTLVKVPGARNRQRYLDSFVALQRKAEKVLGPDAQVADLLTVSWDELYKSWGATNADWMHLRRALSRFASLYMGDKYDVFARQLRQIIPAKKAKKRRPKLTAEQFIAITEAVPAHAAAAYWVLVITGVRIGEYLRSRKEHLHAPTHTYDVPGTKTDASDDTVGVDPRWWIYLERGIPARLEYKWLHTYWTRACVSLGLGSLVDTGKTRRVRKKLERGQQYSHRSGDGAIREVRAAAYETVPVLRYVGPTLHDLRHCHGQWAVNEGVAESKVQGSLRHENPSQTRDYVMQAGTRDVSSALADRLLGTAEPAPTKQRGGRA